MTEIRLLCVDMQSVQKSQQIKGLFEFACEVKVSLFATLFNNCYNKF